ncbi:aquaporin [Martelella mediterranea]|uniref:Glycerol uptake facilitator-like aquaporin n=1 Tax=Martelella mediterranea TaxID=293089 RepID=A0A4R3NTM4_9HYPH|nr:MIP/aquaporin family protein [Martelella mediterranea]TCT40876.1 glycerol uptake facilitator-like aquaporin [Martelella mediterranea]
MRTLTRNLAAEFIGTAALLTAVIGSGVMADTLAGDAKAVALFGNVIPTIAMLYVLITALLPVSGAHFNPAVTAVFWWRGEIDHRNALGYIAVQCVGGIAGVCLAHAMFSLDVVQFSIHPRNGYGQWLAEWVATFGLMLTILTVRETRPDSLAVAVPVYILAACWFTASTSFANPAVTLARMFSDTYAGIRPVDVVPFVLCQLTGAFSAHFCVLVLAPSKQ